VERPTNDKNVVLSTTKKKMSRVADYLADDAVTALL
jgi:hypothetical protein